MASRWIQDVGCGHVAHIFALSFFDIASIAEIGDYFVLPFFRSRVYRLDSYNARAFLVRVIMLVVF